MVQRKSRNIERNFDRKNGSFDSSQCAVVLVVPVFDRFNVVDLVNDLKHQTVKNIKLVVVDHGRKKLPKDLFSEDWVEVLPESSEYWFTGAVNRGLEVALRYDQFSYVGILNDDVRIKDVRWLEKLGEVLDSRPKCFVASSCMDFSGHVVYASIRWRLLKFSFEKEYRGKLVSQVSAALRTCDALPTRGMLTTRSAVLDVGLLDERMLPQYGSDYEWTMRAKKNGYDLLMSSYVYVTTTIKEGADVVSGRATYANQPWKNFLKDLSDPYKSGSVTITINFAFAALSFPYRYFYICYHIFRKIIGFALANLMRAQKAEI